MRDPGSTTGELVPHAVRGLRHRQADGERAAGALFARNRDVPAVKADHIGGAGETQSVAPDAADVAGAAMALEDSIQIERRNTDAVIRDRRNGPRLAVV